MAIMASGVKRIGIPSHKEGVNPYWGRDVGDALASIVGGRWGRRSYTLWGHRRTWEGSITMFVVSLVAVALTLLVLPGSSLSPTADVLQTGPALLSALTAAAVATLAEAVAPAGMDNLSVPLLTSAALYLLL